MTAYLLRRAFFALLLILTVSSSALLLTRAVPGDWATESLDVRASEETRAQMRARYGLDQPIATQYAAWLAGVLRMDFGRSFMFDRPVADLVPERTANTALVALAALFVATLVGVPLGTLTGSGRAGRLAPLVQAASVAILSTPPLLISLLLVVVAARTGWFPLGGMRSVTGSASPLTDLLSHMIVPVVALALPVTAVFERVHGQAMRETIGQPFVSAAQARGVPVGRIVWVDALKAGARPIVSVYGLVMASLLSGSFVVEMVTAWPGLGRLMFDALRARDTYLIAGCATAGSIVLAAGMFIADVMLAAVDPRVRG